MQKRNCTRILALLLSTLLILTNTGCLLPDMDYEMQVITGTTASASQESTPAETPPETRTPSSEPASSSEEEPQSESGSAESESVTEPTSETAPGPGTEQAPPIPEYYHYDKEAFLGDVTRLLNAKSESEVLSLYDSLYANVLELMTLRTVAEIEYDRDTTNTAASDEASYTYNALMECGNSFLAACRELTAGQYADAFKAHVGEDAFSSYSEYKTMSKEELKLKEREDNLEDEYDAIWNSLDDFTFEYEGELWTLTKLNGYEGSMLYMRDPEGYFDVVFGLEGVVFDRTVEIYMELVQIRDRIAKLNGYENYAKYAYEEVYCRDFTTEDAQRFCDAVKSISRIHYDDVRYGAAASAVIDASFTPEGLMSKLGEVAADFDDEVYAQWEYLSKNKLYDIGSDEVRLNASFTTYIQTIETPFIFCKVNGGFNDFVTLSHEFGHFINFHNKKEDNVLIAPDRFDLSEIHSTGLELLMTNKYDMVYGNQADAAAKREVASSVSAVFDGCIYDEFQRMIYENPSMTKEQIRDLFYDLCVEYGRDNNAWGLNYDWIFVPHNFSSPMYYLSYAVSGIASLEIWETGQSDLSSGIALWKEVLSYSDNDKGYLEVAAACGLHPIIDGEAVKNILINALSFID